MKKPKDITELATRLASAASTPLVAPQPATPLPVAAEPMEEAQSPAPATAPVSASREAGKRKAANRSTVPVFLRLSQDLFEKCDKEAVRRTKATGRGVTVQQVILDRLEGATA